METVITSTAEGIILNNSWIINNSNCDVSSNEIKRTCDINYITILVNRSRI